MQYYISGTIIFLIIEMTAQFAYYRYINKHGGGASSLAFLFVIATLSAARNSLSFFLLLIVCMGLSVVRENLGGVMGRVRLLTGFHFIFGGKSARLANELRGQRVRLDSMFGIGSITSLKRNPSLVHGGYGRPSAASGDSVC